MQLDKVIDNYQQHILIEGVTGESNIASVWRDHYNSVFQLYRWGDATQLTVLNAMMLMKIYWFYQMKLRKL